jgi:hypothetical protein
MRRIGLRDDRWERIRDLWRDVKARSGSPRLTTGCLWRRYWIVIVPGCRGAICQSDSATGQRSACGSAVGRKAVSGSGCFNISRRRRQRIRDETTLATSWTAARTGWFAAGSPRSYQQRPAAQGRAHRRRMPCRRSAYRPPSWAAGGPPPPVRAPRPRSERSQSGCPARRPGRGSWCSVRRASGQSRGPHQFICAGTVLVGAHNGAVDHGSIDDRPRQMAELADLTILQLTLEHTIMAGVLPPPHRDPFDRLLAAHAILDGYTMLSTDPDFDGLRTEGLVSSPRWVRRRRLPRRGRYASLIRIPPPGAWRCASLLCR